MVSHTFNATYTFTPLSMGQLLDRAFRLYRRNFLTFVAIIAIVQLVPTLFNLLAALGPEFALAPSLGAIAGSVIGLFGSAAITIATTQSCFGQTPTISGAYGAIKTQLGLLIGLAFLLIVIVLVLVFWTLVPLVGWFTGPGIIFFVSAGVSPLLVPIIILENISIEAGLRRSWDLSRERFWWIMGLTLIVSLLSQVIVTGPVLVTLGLGQFWFGGDSVWPIILQSFVTLVIGSLYTPFTLTLYTLVYFDLRIRAEGLDLSIAAAPRPKVAEIGEIAEIDEQEVETTAVPLLLQNAPPPEKGNRITRREVGYFVGLSLIIYAILTVYIGATVGLAVGLVNSGVLFP
ncbi:MAG: hypothetical protein KDD89_04575 [Anaerolineales bacterium]|nr:hypothetical protein [Anaerolineales bacterium]